MTEDVTPDGAIASERIAKFRANRQRIKELNDKFDALLAPLKAEQDRITNEMLGMLDEMGVGSLRGANDEGTAYVTIRKTLSVADKQTFLDHVIENELWHLLPTSVNRGAAMEMLDEDGELPPGVTLKQFRTVNFKQ